MDYSGVEVMNEYCSIGCEFEDLLSILIHNVSRPALE